MKKIILILIAVIMLCTAAIAESQSDTGNGIMERFVQREYQTIWENMADVMQGSITVDQLTATVDQLGEIKDYHVLANNEVQGYMVYSYYVCQNNEYVYQLSIDQDGKLAGFFIQPYTAPAQSDESLHTETILLRAGKVDETTAVLTLPDGDGPFPAVILVQGSGPSDLNESAYGIHPFLDIAAGLARQGIASIRYDKYTYAHPELCVSPDFTVQAEYMLDADAALAALEADPRISQVFLVGHSQGGVLMPRMIAELGADRFSGGISLSGSPLHLWEIIYWQNQDVLSLMNETDRATYLPVIEAEADHVRALAELSAEEVPEGMFFGLPAYYLWDECQTEAVDFVAANNIPVLFMQGEYDWQVSMDHGLEAWRKLVPQADYAIIPSATHLLTQIDAPTGTQVDYKSGAHVCQEAIDTMAAWILHQAE